MDEKKLEKYRRQLGSQTPIIGGWLRSSALNNLRREAAAGDQEAREELCRLVIEQDHSDAREIAVAAAYAPRDANRRALFYFLTEQWEKYESLDFDQSFLKSTYQVQGDGLQARIAAVARKAGRVELVEVVSGGRRGLRLGRMTDGEWQAVLEVLVATRMWEETWRLAQEAPPRWSVQILNRMKGGGYVFHREEERTGYEKLVRMAEWWKEPDLRSFVCCRATLQGHSDPVSCLAMSPNGRALASGSWDNTVRLWSLPDGEPIKTLQGHSTGVTCLAMSPDGRVLASVGSNDNTVRLWSLADGVPIKTLLGHSETVICLAMSPDGRVLASGSQDKTVRLWSLPDGGRLKTLQGYRESVHCLAMSADGQVLAGVGGSDDIMVRLWSLPAGKPLKTLRHRYPVNCLAMSPDGRVLASGIYKDVRLWSLPDGKPLKTLQGHSDNVNRLAMSPDGRVLASTEAYDNTVRLWSLPDGEPIKTLQGHSRVVNCLAMSPDGRVLASGSRDKTVRLWSLPDGKPIKTLEGHSDEVKCLAMNPEGRGLASGSADKTVRLWTSRLVDLSCLPVNKTTLADLAWAQGALHDGQTTYKQRKALEFIVELMMWHRRFDIGVGDSTRHIEVGEFDIEIEV